MVPSIVIAFSESIVFVDACPDVTLAKAGRSGEQRGAQLSAGCAIIPGLPAIAPRKRTLRTIRARTIFAWTSFIHVQRAAI